MRTFFKFFLYFLGWLLPGRLKSALVEAARQRRARHLNISVDLKCFVEVSRRSRNNKHTYEKYTLVL